MGYLLKVSMDAYKYASYVPFAFGGRRKSCGSYRKGYTTIALYINYIVN